MSFFADLSIVITVAAIISILFSRFNLPLTVGYILAGFLVGPHFGLKLISNSANIQMLSDLGVMFLMFSIGLGFRFRHIRQLGGRVVFPAVWDVLFMVIGGFFVGKLLGWNNLECFLLGLILCDSSTSIAAKTLNELGWTTKRFASSTFAIALIEDVLAILLIAVLNGISGDAGGSSAGIWATLAVIGKQMITLTLFLVGVTILGLLIVPRVMDFVSKRFGREILLMAALGFCFGISCLAQEGLGLSLVVGAFLAGAVMAESKTPNRIEHVVTPVSNLFAAVFFVSVGLMIEPTALWHNIGTILFITFAMIVLKLVNGIVSNILVGEQPRDAFKIGIGLGQVAEFSFIIAGIALAGRMSERPLYQIAVGVALLCTATNPYLLRYSDKLYDLLRPLAGKRARTLLLAYRMKASETMNSQDATGSSIRRHIYMILVQIAIAGVIAAIIFAFVHFIVKLPSVAMFLQPLDRIWQPQQLHLSWRNLLSCIVALLLASPALWTMNHLWHKKLMHYIIDEVLMNSLPQLCNVARGALHLIAILGLLGYSILLCSTFLNHWLLFGIPIFAVLLVGSFLSPRFKANYEATHKEIVNAFDTGTLTKEEVNINDILGVHTETIHIPVNAAVAQKTLGELNLRGETGAAIITVANPGEKPIISPGRDTLLCAGASVIVAGSDAEINRAIALLTRTEATS